MIIAAFINGFLARNRSLERVYATEITKNVDMIQLTDAMINVFHTSVYRLRWQAYEDALSSHGLSTEYLAESGYQCERAYRELTEVLTMHPEITAICSISDIVTPAAIRAIHDLGKIPGKDVHIISFDGMPSMHYCIPSISTFIQPRDEMAGYIYDLLLGLISDERQHQHITFQTRFSPGESE